LINEGRNGFYTDFFVEEASHRREVVNRDPETYLMGKKMRWGVFWEGPKKLFTGDIPECWMEKPAKVVDVPRSGGKIICPPS